MAFDVASLRLCLVTDRGLAAGRSVIDIALAAVRGGIRVALIPEENVKDLTEIPDLIKNRIEIIPVKWIDKVLELALERLPVPLRDEKTADSEAAVAATGDAPPASGVVVTH